jgi:hypothetical protein
MSMEQWWNDHYRGGGDGETFPIATSFASNLTWFVQDWTRASPVAADRLTSRTVACHVLDSVNGD